MSRWLQELRHVVSWPAFYAVMYYASLLGFILQSHEPRNLFYLNEMFMALFVVLVTYVWFQPEIGGGMMEMVSTYPLSLTGMVLRKLFLLQLAVLVCHALLMGVYVWRLGPLETAVFPWDGGTAVIRTASWWELYGQALPGYFIMSALTIFGFVLGKRVYWGLGIGFAYWMLEGTSSGGATGMLTLFTVNLQREELFAVNRLLLVAAGGILLAAALVLINKRARWIAAESDS